DRRCAMNLPRRQFLRVLAGTAALATGSRIAPAQMYPTRSVRIVVGFAAGGPADINARLIWQLLSARLGQQHAVAKRTGAGGNIAAEAVLRTSPDGYTLLLTCLTQAVNASLYQRLNFDWRDIVPVAGISQEPIIMVVNPSLPARTVLEFMAYAKGRPEELTMASAGIGTPAHMTGELFQMMTGVRMRHVPYRGGAPALTDLIGGQVD